MRQLMRRRAVCFMSAIILAISLILWVCKVFIAPPPVQNFVSYVEHMDDDQPEETKQQDIDTPSAPPTTQPVPEIIVAPTMPSITGFTMDVDMTDLPVSDSSINLGQSGLGDGIGKGSSKKGGMGGKEQISSAFLGTFWDFKRTKDGKDSQYGAKNPYASPEVLALEGRFFTKYWDLVIFSPYYRAKQRLYATCFYMPNCLDKEACHAYDPDGKMGLKETRWAALYRARVRAPESGRFRFVGVADSVMAVRFNGQNVLSCGLHDLITATMNRWVPDTYPEANKGRELIAYASCDVWNDSMGGFVAGEPFTVKKGEWYDMQVLISEIGGRGFGFCLLIEYLDENNEKKTKDGKPLLQLFRTALSAPTAKEAYEAMDPSNIDETILTDMPYDEDSQVWEAKPIGLEEKMK